MEQAEDDVIDVLLLIPPEILINDNEDIDENPQDRLHQDGDEEINSTDVPMNVDGNLLKTNQGDCNILEEIVNRLYDCPSCNKWKLTNHLLYQNYI